MSTKVAVVVGEDIRRTIQSASEHRRLLLDAMVALVEQRMSIGQANALVGLSAEVHKSIRAEFDVVCYAAENFWLGEGNQLKFIEDSERE